MNILSFCCWDSQSGLGRFASATALWGNTPPKLRSRSSSMISQRLPSMGFDMAHFVGSQRLCEWRGGIMRSGWRGVLCAMTRIYCPSALLSKWIILSNSRNHELSFHPISVQKPYSSHQAIGWKVRLLRSIPDGGSSCHPTCPRTKALS
jgi:hypothetical protein